MSTGRHTGRHGALTRPPRGGILRLSMPDTPIQIDLSATDPEISRLERHSFVNLINVIHAELQLVERMVDAPGSLRSAIHLAEAASRAFKESRVARRHLGEFVRFASLIESDLEETLAEAGEAAHEDDVREACSILRTVLPDAHLRVHEVVARHRLPWPERAFDPADLTAVLAERDVEVTIEAPAPELRLPDGIDLALVAMADSAEREAGVGRVAIEQEDVTRITVSGSAPSDYFAPLTGHLRPSELHAILADRGEPLRGAIQLVYYAVPDGGAWIAGSGDGEFALRAELPPPTTIDQTD